MDSYLYFDKRFIVKVAGFFLAAAVTLGVLQPWNRSPKEIFRGEINGGQVYFGRAHNSLFNVWHAPDTMIFYRQQKIYASGTNYEITVPAVIIEDCGEDGIIGNDYCDSYVVFTGIERKVIYGKDFVVDENGVRFSANGSELEKRLTASILPQKLDKATALYAETKKAIEAELKSRLLGGK